MPRLTIDLPESIPAEEARLEMAIGLYRSGRLTQGEAARLAGYTRPTFIEMLAKRGMPFTNVDVEDFDQELATWRGMSASKMVEAPPRSDEEELTPRVNSLMGSLSKRGLDEKDHRAWLEQKHR